MRISYNLYLVQLSPSLYLILYCFLTICESLFQQKWKITSSFPNNCSRENPNVRPTHPPMLENRVIGEMVRSLLVIRTFGSKTIFNPLVKSTDRTFLDSMFMVLHGILQSFKKYDWLKKLNYYRMYTPVEMFGQK